MKQSNMLFKLFLPAMLLTILNVAPVRAQEAAEKGKAAKQSKRPVDKPKAGEVLVPNSQAVSQSVLSGGVSVSDDAAAAPDASAMLDVSVTGISKKGVLIPRMTEADRTAITLPATGLLVFQTDGSAGFYYYTGSLWTQLTAGGIGGSGTVNYLSKFTDATTLGNSAIFESGGKVGIGTTAPGASSTSRTRATPTACRRCAYRASSTSRSSASSTRAGRSSTIIAERIRPPH